MKAALIAALALSTARAQDLSLSDAVIDRVRGLPAYQAIQQVNAKLMAGDPPVAPSILTLLPTRNVGHGGRPADPLTVVFLGSAEQIQKALAGAGWTQVPLGDRAAIEKGLEDTFWHRHRPPNLPFRVYHLNGKREDFNWSMAQNLNTRHHFRLWRTDWKDDHGRELWWGSGDYDIKVRLRDFSHVVDPDVGLEMRFIKDSLAQSPDVSAMWIKFLPQVKGEIHNDSGYVLRTDGSVLFVGLTTAP